jgi:hypothetical protein
MACAVGCFSSVVVQTVVASGRRLKATQTESSLTSSSMQSRTLPRTSEDDTRRSPGEKLSTASLQTSQAGSIPLAIDAHLSPSENHHLLYHGEAQGRPLVLLVGLSNATGLLDVLHADGMHVRSYPTEHDTLEALMGSDLLPDCVLVSSTLPVSICFCPVVCALSCQPLCLP